MITIKCFLLLAVTISGVWTKSFPQSESSCNAYGFNCISDKEFQLCGGGSSNAHLCPLGTQCTSNYSQVCVGNLLSSRAALARIIAFECSEIGFFVDPNSECKNYFICVENPDGDGLKKIPSVCPANMLFDQDSQICKAAPEVKCSSPPTCNAYGFYCVTDKIVQFCDEAGQTPSGPTQDCTNDRICKENCMAHCILPELEGNLCTALEFECKEEGLFPDPNNCYNFIICTENNGQFIQIAAHCPEKSAFDPALKTCTEKAYADCGEPQQPEPKCTEEGFFAKPGDCYSFYICTKNGEEFEKLSFRCPDGSAFDSALKTCTEEAYRKCNNEEPPLCTQEGFFSNPNDCYSFFICSKNGDQFEQLSFKCPEGSAFDSALKTCTEAAYDKCKGVKPFECKKEGFFRDPENCRNFIICSPNGNEFVKLSYNCPDGFAFDTNSNTCTKEALANCAA